MVKVKDTKVPKLFLAITPPPQMVRFTSRL